MSFPDPPVIKVPVVRLDWRHLPRLSMPVRSHSGIRGLVSLCSLIGMLILLSVCATAQEPTRKVLIISGSDPNYAGFSIITRKIVSTLRDGSRTRVEVLYELERGLIDS